MLLVETAERPLAAIELAGSARNARTDRAMVEIFYIWQFDKQFEFTTWRES